MGGRCLGGQGKTMFPYPLRQPVVGCLQVPTAHGPGVKPMTTANAQPRMARNTEAMVAAPQSLPAANAQPMVYTDAFHEGAWMWQDLRLPNASADLIPDWHRDQVCPSDYARGQAAAKDVLAAEALGHTLSELQVTCRAQLSAMHQYEAETPCNTNECPISIPCKNLLGVGPPLKTTKVDTNYVLKILEETKKGVTLGWDNMCDLKESTARRTFRLAACDSDYSMGYGASFDWPDRTRNRTWMHGDIF